ncbi:MAG TPA: hypothetical protein VND19_16340 [Acetobacteraceae bacterium]|nr:hypothetical protein [Acetobacteraceae bacterium]
MPDSFAILALRRKRAHLAGQIDQAERRIDPLRAALAHLDAVLRLFDATSNPELIPTIRPTTRGTFFRHGEQMRLCLEALREAGKPMRVRSVTEYAMLAKGLPVDDARVREGIADQVRIALGRMEKRGLVRRVVREPEGWWEVVG